MNNLLLSGCGGGICSQVIVFKDGVLTPVNWSVILGAFFEAEEIYLSVVENNKQITLLELEGDFKEEELTLIGRDYINNKTYILSNKSNKVIILDNLHVGFAYKSISKIDDFSYEVDYDELDYSFAAKYFELYDYSKLSGCTEVRKGDLIARNYDYTYSNDCCFYVRVPAKGKRHGSFGFSGSIPGLDKETLLNNKYSELFYALPFVMVDGKNDAGVFCAINVVPQDYGITTKTIPDVEEREELPVSMLVRYVLDHYSTAQEAVEDIKKHISLLNTNRLRDQGFEAHFMIGDSNKSYVLEIIDNRVFYLESNVLTNFYLYGVEFDEDNKVELPTIGDPIGVNHITYHGSGLERWNLIQDNYDDITTEEKMINLMRNILNYTNAYTLTENKWYSEFVGHYGEIDIALNASIYIFETAQAAAADLYANRDRNNPQTWFTSHTSIYNLTSDNVIFYTPNDDGVKHVFNGHGGKKYYTVDEIDALLNK